MAIADALDYRTYHLHHRFLPYNEYMALGTATMAKRMEMIMKPCRFDDSAPVTMLSFWDSSRKSVTPIEYSKM